VSNYAEGTSNDELTLFDCYFLASIGGLASVVNIPCVDIKTIEEVIPDTIINSAFDMAKAAIKKRNEYFLSDRGC
jgi:hypothetical protein